MILLLLKILICVLALLLTADRLVLGASSLARIMGLSPMVIGLTLVAIGTSAPEIFVSIVAAFAHKPDIGIGNAVGSNIANIALIVGITAAMQPIKVSRDLLVQQIPIMLAITLLPFFLLTQLGVTPMSGIILILTGSSYIAWLYWQSTQRSSLSPGLISEEEVLKVPSSISLKMAIIWLIVGLIGLPVAADYFVDYASTLARLFGMSDLTIGITIVALGTSLPELLTSIIGVLKKEDALALGSIVGSNIFNFTFVISPPCFVTGAQLNPVLVTRDLPVVILLSLLFTLFCYAHKRDGKIKRSEGLALLCLYGLYLSLIMTQG